MSTVTIHTLRERSYSKLSFDSYTVYWRYCIIENYKIGKIFETAHTRNVHRNDCDKIYTLHTGYITVWDFNFS